MDMEPEESCEKTPEDIPMKPVLCDLSDFRPKRSVDCIFQEEAITPTPVVSPADREAPHHVPPDNPDSAQSSQHSTAELPAQSSQHSSAEFTGEAQSSQHSSAELTAQSSQYSSAELTAQSSQHSSAELTAQSSQHSSAELTAQSSQHSTAELTAQSSQHSTAELPAQSSQHSSAELTGESPSSVSCRSTGFECPTLFDLDTEDTTMASDLHENAFSRSSGQSDFQFPMESGSYLSKSSTANEWSFMQEGGFMSYPSDIGFDYMYQQYRCQTSEMCNRSDGLDPSQESIEHDISPDPSQQSVPLRIPDLQPPEPRFSQQLCTEGESHEESPLNFLSGFFPSTDFSKEPLTNQIDFDTEFSFSNRGYVSPTEFLNKPHQEQSQESVFSIGSSVYEGRYEEKQIFSFESFGSKDSQEAAVTSAGMDFSDPWQQFCLDPHFQSRSSNNRTSPDQYMPYYNSDQAQPSCSTYSHVSSSSAAEMSSLAGQSYCSEYLNNLEPVTLPSPYLAQFSPVSDPCEGISSRMTDSSDTDSSIIDPTTTPPNPAAQTTPYHNQTGEQRHQINVSKEISFLPPPPPPVSLPPPPPLSLPPRYENSSQRFPSTSNSTPIPPMSSFIPYSQPVSYSDCLPTSTNVLRPLHLPSQSLYSSRPGPVVPPNKVITSRPFQAWNQLQTSTSRANMYPAYPYISRYPNPSKTLHSLGNLPRGTPVVVEESGERDHIKLVPIPDSRRPRPYSCPLEWYARNSSRYTAIKPLPSDAARRQKCCEQNMRCSLWKVGAVSIKTKEGKFLCMASDFHTKTVRELLESAETCKASSASDTGSGESAKQKQGGEEAETTTDATTPQGSTEDKDAPQPRSEGRPWETATGDKPAGGETHSEMQTGENLIDSSSDNSKLPHSQQPQVDFSSIPNLASSQNNKESSCTVERIDLTRSTLHSDTYMDAQNGQVVSGSGADVAISKPTYVSQLQPGLSQISSVTPETPIFQPSPNVQGDCLPVLRTNPVYTLRHQADKGLTAAPSIPGTDLVYRGAIVVNRPYSSKHHPNPSPSFASAPENHHHFMFSPGTGTNYFSPLLPPRDVQLRTAQPYPLIPLPSNGQPYPPGSVPQGSLPYIVPHASSYHSDIPVYSSSHMNNHSGSSTGLGIQDPVNHAAVAASTTPRWPLPQSQDNPSMGNTSAFIPSSGYCIGNALNSGQLSNQAVGVSRPNTVFCEKLQLERGHLKKSYFKPKHFDFTCLEIGNYKYICDHAETKTAKIKIIFSKKKLVYEFQLNEMEDAFETHRKQLALIEVPFSSIISLSGEGRDLRIEVSIPPKVYQGEQLLQQETKFGIHLNARFDRSMEDDMTAGEVHHVPYHYIQLKVGNVDKFKHQLELFDRKFEVLLQLPFMEQPGKTLSKEPIALVPFTRLKKSAVLEETERPSGSNMLKRRLPQPGCHCTTGCSTARCSCSKQLRVCSGSCQCKNCQNCLNMLKKANINMQAAKADACLIQNILQVANLERFLDTEVLLSCCLERVSIRKCIPGEVACPSYPRCLARYKFSWCSGTLCDQVKSPRNHCKICQTCFGKHYRHCGSCNQCYFAGSGQFSCPNCSTVLAQIREAKSVRRFSDADIVRNILPT